jgi:hypothetical protein
MSQTSRAPDGTRPDPTFWVTFWVHCPDTSKPLAAFPLVGGLSSVSTQSAPEGIRTPNLLIRSNSIDPTPREAARPGKKPGQMFPQVNGVRTRQGGSGRDVTEPRSAEFWVTFWVTTAGAGQTRAAVGPRLHAGLSTLTWRRAQAAICRVLVSLRLRTRAPELAWLSPV